MRMGWKRLGARILRSSGRLGYVEAAARHVLSGRGGPRSPAYEIQELTPLRPRESVCPQLRLNLLVPSINVSDSYGGIRTAVKMFELLGKAVGGTSGVRLRIVTSAPVIDESIVDLARWERLDSDESDNRPCGIVEVEGRGPRELSVSTNDVFVATFWPTAYEAARLRVWQESQFGWPAAPLIYLIQDFEPAFYPWSSRYAYAEGTYAHGASTIAVFNSSLLRDYFESRGYSFLRAYHFEPRISDELKSYLSPDGPKRRRIVVYGRPSSARNCFETICAGLRQWSLTRRARPGWTIVSAGEKHANVPLENGLEILSVGKLSLRAYADLLNESAVGISLMLSPHPSYPPLDMAHAGVLTITNSYANKNLSSWHENIWSISEVDPGELARSVERLVGVFEGDSRAGAKGMSKVDVYLRGGEEEPWVHEVARELQSFMENRRAG